MTTAFYRYFHEQNEAIKAGKLSGVELNLKTLGVSNGIIDAATQFPSVGSMYMYPFDFCNILRVLRLLIRFYM